MNFVDHRTGLTVFGIEKMLNGDFLEQFIDEYSKQVQNAKLQVFLESLSEETNEEIKK